MSEQAQSNNQQTIVIGLVVIAALLAAIVGVLVYQTSKSNQVPAPTATAPTTNTGTTGTMGGATGGTTAPTDTAFDPKTATKLPAGTQPEAWVKAYYTACEKGDWKAAFDALPTAKKAGNSPDALKEQVTGYGIKSFKISSAVVNGDKATIKADQVTTSYGTFENTWTFVKQGGVWLVESKAVTGMK